MSCISLTWLHTCVSYGVREQSLTPNLKAWEIWSNGRYIIQLNNPLLKQRPRNCYACQILNKVVIIPPHWILPFCAGCLRRVGPNLSLELWDPSERVWSCDQVSVVWWLVACKTSRILQVSVRGTCAILYTEKAYSDFYPQWHLHRFGIKLIPFNDKGCVCLKQ